MHDDDIFDAVARLVAGGEYLDDIPGRAGVDLDGGGMFVGGLDGATMQRVYTRGSRRYLEAKARGWIEPLPPLRPAPLAAVEEAEALAGVSLPPLLRRLYLEVGNGGFGPGYGLAGLRGGHDNGAATTSLQRRRTPGGGPELPMFVCGWGCAITSTIDLADGQMWGSDPNAAVPGVSTVFPEHMTFSEWLARWLESRLYQPWLMQDPVTGRWRGATEADHTEAWQAYFADEDSDD